MIIFNYPLKNHFLAKVTDAEVNQIIVKAAKEAVKDVAAEITSNHVVKTLTNAVVMVDALPNKVVSLKTIRNK